MMDPLRDPVAEASTAAVRRLLAGELGLPSRVGYTALLLAGLTTASVAAALLLGEDSLPGRTRVAFLAIVVIGLAWAGFALWVLARRRVLFAAHRVIAARMAVVFSAIFTAGAAAIAFGAGSTAAALSAAVGLVLLVLALLLQSRARRRVAWLVRRREELERQITAGGRG